MINDALHVATDNETYQIHQILIVTTYMCISIAKLESLF